jgi:hypothetical protein
LVGSSGEVVGKGANINLGELVTSSWRSAAGSASIAASYAEPLDAECQSI